MSKWWDMQWDIESKSIKSSEKVIKMIVFESKKMVENIDLDRDGGTRDKWDGTLIRILKSMQVIMNIIEFVNFTPFLINRVIEGPRPKKSGTLGVLANKANGTVFCKNLISYCKYIIKIGSPVPYRALILDTLIH